VWDEQEISIESMGHGIGRVWGVLARVKSFPGRLKPT